MLASHLWPPYSCQILVVSVSLSNFSPSGWDSLNKIRLLEQNLTKYRASDDFSKVVSKPQEERKTTNDEPEVTAMDDQVRHISDLYIF